MPVNLLRVLNRMWGFLTNQFFLSKVRSWAVEEILTRTDSNTNILLSLLGSSCNEEFAMVILKFVVNQREVLSNDGIEKLFFQKRRFI